MGKSRLNVLGLPGAGGAAARRRLRLAQPLKHVGLLLGHGAQLQWRPGWGE